jgi:hypothetical protein
MTGVTLTYTQLFGSYIVYNYLTHILTLILFLLQFVDIRYYIIYGEKDTFREICKNIEKETYVASYKHSNGRDSPGGHFIGWSCIGYFETLEKYEDSEKIRIITTTKFYKKILQIKEVEYVNSFTEEKVVPSKIYVYNRTGSYKNFYYERMSLNIGNITPLGQQEEILDSISDIYDRQNRATIFIHGVSCAGKSSIGYLLAKKYKGRFCHSFNPIDAGDQISSLIRIMQDDDSNAPVIIVLEEVDTIIKAIHTNSVKINKEVPTSIYNKSTWSTFLDDMIFYKNVILILTSNDSKESIDALDTAYLRKGRIHETYTMNYALPL